MSEEVSRGEAEEEATARFFEAPVVAEEHQAHRPRSERQFETPSSSWTLLDSVIDADTLLAESVESSSQAVDEDDDGMSDEERRLELASERLEEELEAEAKRVSPPATPTPTPSRRRWWIAAAVVVVFAAAASARAVAPSPPPREDPKILETLGEAVDEIERGLAAARGKVEDVVLSEFEKSKARLVGLVGPEWQRSKQKLARAVAKSADDLKNRSHSLRDKIQQLLARDQPAVPRLLCSLGFGAAGLAVGVPYVPGITDNLVVAVAAAALPFLKSEDDL